MISRGRLFLYRLIFGSSCWLALWELSSGRLIDPFWVSSPSKVFGYIYEVFADGSIFAHLGITLYETFTGFFIGSIFGIGLGFFLGRREILAQIFWTLTLSRLTASRASRWRRCSLSGSVSARLQRSFWLSAWCSFLPFSTLLPASKASTPSSKMFCGLWAPANGKFS